MAEEEGMDIDILGYGPWEIKELLIESAMRSHFDQAMTHQLKDEDLLRAVSYDPEDLEIVDSGAPSYTGVDLYTALRVQEYELARHTYLQTIGFKLLDNPKVRNQISDMLDTELKQRVQKKYFDRPRSLLQKFILVAGARVKAAMLVEELFNPIDVARNKIGFTIHLTTLRGGYAGNTQTQRLYFTFPENLYDSSSYILFLAQLQDATQLSTIPPLEPGEPYCTTSESTTGSFNHPDRKWDTGTPSNALGIMLPTPDDSFTSTPAPRQPKRDVRGYTISDGPWVYTSKLSWKVLMGKTGAEKEKTISDKSSYDNMIQVLKAQTTVVVDKEGRKEFSRPSAGHLFVEIMHSMDRAALKSWIQEKEAEDEEEKRFRLSLVSQGFADDDIGEPYHAYMKRSIASEKEKASRKHYTEILKETAKERISKTTEEMRKEFFGRYSPAFAQAPFEAEVKERSEKVLEQLDKELEKIPKDTSGF